MTRLLSLALPGPLARLAPIIIIIIGIMPPVQCIAIQAICSWEMIANLKDTLQEVVRYLGDTGRKFNWQL